MLISLFRPILFIVLLISVSLVSPVSATVSRDAFRELGIQLNNAISTTYSAGDGILIEGKILDNKTDVLFYLKSLTTDQKVLELGAVESNGNFRIPISLPRAPGKYAVVITSGRSFSTQIDESIEIVSTVPQNTIGGNNIQVRPYLLYEPRPYLYFGSNMQGELTLTQGKKSHKQSGEIIMIDDSFLQYGNAQAVLRGNSREGNRFTWSGSVYIDRDHQIIGKELVSLRMVRSLVTMQFRLKKGELVQSDYFLTLPNGDVVRSTFAKEYIAPNGYLRTDTLIRQTFQIPRPGVYKIETVLGNGLAYFNLPISKNPFWSIKETLTSEQKKLTNMSKNQVEIDVLKKVNSIRGGLGRPTLSIDPKLNNLAQQKAQDMAKYEYLAHTTKNGLSILAFAKSIGISITGSIGENIAGGDVSSLQLQDGLEESGSHRANMIDPSWRHIGIGYTVKNGKAYLVQIFGE